MCKPLRFANRNQPRKSVFFFTLRTTTSDVICHRIHSKCKLEKHNKEQQQTNCLLRSGLSFSVSANGNCFDNCFWRIFMLFFISTKIPMEAFQQREFRSVHKKPREYKKEFRMMKGNSDMFVATRCATPSACRFSFRLTALCVGGKISTSTSHTATKFLFNRIKWVLKFLLPCSVAFFG